jgi:hypothetical protein
VEHFRNLFRVQEGTSIIEIVQVEQLFPYFVEEEENEMLMSDVLEGYLSEVLHSFQKDKSLVQGDWPIEIIGGFL